jgi:flagellar hook protein FlgE
MGISSALYSGVSGMNTNSQAMSVIGNNLANTNTIGFKGSRTLFSDLLSSTVFGAGGASQVGRGVGMSKVDSIFSQGTFETTDSDTDLAIEGDGFFMLKEIGNSTSFFSRAGAFRFDKDGYLVNPEGFRVQGKSFDPNTNELVPGDPADIMVETTSLVPAKVTDLLTLNSNLDAGTVAIASPTSALTIASTLNSAAVAIPAATLFDPALPATYDLSTTSTTYDNLGESHAITTYFRKDDVAANTWNCYWSAQDDAGLPLGNGAGSAPSATLVFNPLTGALISGGTDTITATELDWGNGSTPTAITLTHNSTQSAATSSVTSQTQNGRGLPFDPANTTTYDYAASTQTYDTQGNPHIVTTYFRKDSASNTWNWYWSAKDSRNASLGSTEGSLPAGQIVFNADGKLMSGGTGSIAATELDWGNGSTPTAIDVNFETTQFNNVSKVISQEQNGFASGNLTNITIDDEGVVISSFSNGEQTKIANISLAKFTNPNGLKLVGSNLFLASDLSGVPQVGLPGPELGKIFTNSLEQSNVDMGKEFVNMITVQRGFQANSKIITTVDELLSELINLKR